MTKEPNIIQYRLARNVGGRKHWRIWQIDLNLQTFILQCFTAIEISHAIRVKVSDPVNLFVYVGEKVRREVRLDFK